jgi:hypothetical protein
VQDEVAVVVENFFEVNEKMTRIAIAEVADAGSHRRFHVSPASKCS